MILAEFQQSYPTGSLISELLTIYQGKFVVRVLVQIDGVTRATGMAAAQTPEIAEDEARIRALAVLAAGASVPPPAAAPTQPVAQMKPEPPLQTASSPALPQENHYSNHPATKVAPAKVDYTPQTAPSAELNLEVKGKSNTYDEDFPPLTFNSTPKAEEATRGMEFGMTNVPPTTIDSGETPLFSRNYQLSSDLGFEAPTEVNEPIDLSEELAAIDVKLKESGLTPKQESQYLERTYGTSSCQQLKPEQVQEFRHYLELYTQVDKDLKDLNWTAPKGQDHLIRNYNKKSRLQLTYQELQEFHEYLQSQRQHRR